MSQRSAHVDTWVRDRLPTARERPELRFDLPELQLPERLNCATILLDRHVLEGRGDAPCVVEADRTYSYAQLADRCDRIAHVLVDDLGVVPGNRVLLMGRNSSTLLACWHAVMKVGAVAVTVAPSLLPRELTHVLERANVNAALVGHVFLPRLQDALLDAERADARVARLSWGLGDLERLAETKPGRFAAVDTAADDPCIIAFTSGSTGTPKAAVHTHRDVIATCAVFAGAPVGAKPSDVFVGSPPLAFTFGLVALGCYPLYLGASVVLMERAGAVELAQAIERHRATLCFTVPTVYRTWLRSDPPPDLSSLRVAISSAEPLGRGDWLEFRARTGLEIVNVLGSTEMLHAFISSGVAPPRPGSVGRPIRGYQATVLGPDGRELPDGEIGKLAVKGPTGCFYLDDPRQQEQVCAGWTITGDYARRDDDGYFWLEGRVDDVIISSGYNISPAEVEAVLIEHPGVAECLVVPVRDAVKGAVLKAVVVPTPSLPAVPESGELLREYVLRRLAAYKCPRVVEFVDELPRTATGKVRRRSGTGQ